MRETVCARGIVQQRRAAGTHADPSAALRDDKRKGGVGRSSNSGKVTEVAEAGVLCPDASSLKCRRTCKPDSVPALPR